MQDSGYRMPYCSPPGHHCLQYVRRRAGEGGEDEEGGVREEASVNKKPYPT